MKDYENMNKVCFLVKDPHFLHTQELKVNVGAGLSVHTKTIREVSAHREQIFKKEPL